MKLSSRYVGRTSAPFLVEITDRQAMNYAAATYDGNPIYLDDEREGGCLAPPMLAVALTWQMAARFGDYWETEDFPQEVLAQQVHYSEVLRFHRPLRPGMALNIIGTVAAIQPHPAGTHLVLHFAASDKSGEPVFDEYIGGMLRGVQCEDGGVAEADLPSPPKRSLNGQAIWEKRIAVDPLAAHLYDGAADIHFPIHTSPAFAKAVGLPRTIYHGTATLAQSLRELLEEEAGGDPASLEELSCLFTGMVFPGTEVRVQLLDRETDGAQIRLYFQVLNHEGQRAIRRGCAVVRV
jgi:acyl dehydratase